jgi:hypothetical protein
MEERELVFGNVSISVREMEDGTLVPKNSRVLDAALNGANESFIDKFRVCLTTKDCENEIQELLEDIEKKMTNKKWIFFVADCSKNTNTLEKVKEHNTSASAFFPIKFHHSKNTALAQEALGKISDIYEDEYPYKLEFKKKKSLEIDHKIESFCFVATKEVKEEAAILLKSLRLFHSEPVYVFCDMETKYFISCLNIDLNDVFFEIEMEKESLSKIETEYSFDRINNYHRPECIFKKMECMDFALCHHENTFFLDSDIIVVDQLQEKFDKNIFLSPHYHKIGTPDANGCVNFGFFNAGYVFCASKEFPSFWRETYLDDSEFFEQECMNRICEKFEISFFDRSHNIGFWRSSLEFIEKPRSFHFHAVENENLEKNNHLKDLNIRTKRRLVKLLEESDDERHKEIYEFIEKMGSGWGGRTESFLFRKSNPEGKINLNSQTVFQSHRSGWSFAIEALAPLHNVKGVLFDGFLENNFAWHLEEHRRDGKHIPYREPWVGFFHNPQNMPPWFFYEFSLQNIIAGKEFQESLENCVGLFSLSEYQAEYLREATGKKVSVLIHPTEIPEGLFNYEEFLNNPEKKIVNIGYWLRKLNSIFSLPIESGNTFEKIRLIPYSASRPMEIIDELVEKEKRIYNIEIPDKYSKNTITKSSLPNQEYDDLLSKNIIFLDLYDSSANNAVIECIARATPLLVNPLPAVIEYLGKDYPFYYESLDEAAEKAENFDLIKETHEYLKDCETRDKLSKEHFEKSIQESEVYNLLK